MSHLEAADSLSDLARQLGAACLDCESDLREMQDQPRTGEELERLAAWVAAGNQAVWEEIVANPGLLEEKLGAKLLTRLRRARTRYPLDCLGVLRGLCRRPLAEFFAVTRDQVGLDTGNPVPFATRPIPGVLGPGCTTSVETLTGTSLLHPLPFDLFRPSAKGQLRVILDFAHRHRVDELTWSDGEGLPRIATLHPPGGQDFSVTVTGDRFFDVRPRRFDPDAIEALLADARSAGARIAVLPELSLPAPDALEALIAAEHERFPEIVVAGTAHVVGGVDTDKLIRSNESRVYLDGQFVAMARKHHPFRTKAIGEEKWDKPLTEDLSSEQKTIMVLSGRHTRMAVAICADLQDTEVPRLLVAAGVNLLLVPAMSGRIGSFNAAVCDIAAYCQGVAVVANACECEDGKPFLCFCAVPRELPSEQSAALTGDGVEPAPSLTLLDPNLPLPQAVSWPGR